MSGQPGRRDRAARVPQCRCSVRALVVDDDEVIRQLITLNLELEGFEVHEAVDGLTRCQGREVRPAVVTLDIMMPKLDGWDAAARLRSDPATAHVRVDLVGRPAPRRPTSSAARGSGWTSI